MKNAGDGRIAIICCARSSTCTHWRISAKPLPWKMAAFSVLIQSFRCD